MPASLPRARTPRIGAHRCASPRIGARWAALAEAAHDADEEEADDDDGVHAGDGLGAQLGESSTEAHEGQAHASRQGSVEHGDLGSHVDANADDGGDVEQEDPPAGAGEEGSGDAHVEEEAAHAGGGGELPGCGHHGAHAAQHGAVGGGDGGLDFDLVGGSSRTPEGVQQAVVGELRFLAAGVELGGQAEGPLRGVGVDGFPDAPVGHEELDVVSVGVGGEVCGAAGFLVSPEGDQGEGEFARNRGVSGVDARAGRGRGGSVGVQPLSALGSGHEGEGVGHVIAVGVGARRVFLAQGVQAEAVGAGGGLDVSPVAGVLADDVDAFEDGEGGLVVVCGERGVGVGECGRRHGEYDSARAPSCVSASTKRTSPGQRAGRTPRVS